MPRTVALRERGRFAALLNRILRSARRRTGQPKAKSRQRAAPGQPKPARAKPATTFGYVDIWAGLVLAGKQFLPLDRQLFSAAHPRLPSQPAVEDAVLERALALLRALKLPSIVVGDRGLGRKERLIALATRGQDFVFRIDPDITALSEPGGVATPLAELLAHQPWLGQTVSHRGGAGPAGRAGYRVVMAGRGARPPPVARQVRRSHRAGLLQTSPRLDRRLAHLRTLGTGGPHSAPASRPAGDSRP